MGAGVSLALPREGPLLETSNLHFVFVADVSISWYSGIQAQTHQHHFEKQTSSSKRSFAR